MMWFLNAFIIVIAGLVLGVLLERGLNKLRSIFAEHDDKETTTIDLPGACSGSFSFPITSGRPGPK